MTSNQIFQIFILINFSADTESEILSLKLEKFDYTLPYTQNKRMEEILVISFRKQATSSSSVKLNAYSHI